LLPAIGLVGPGVLSSGEAHRKTALPMKRYASQRSSLIALGWLAFFSVLTAPAVFGTTIELTGSTANWKIVRFGGSGQFDYPSDTQAGSADLDIVGDSNHPMLYTQYDDNGTTGTTADDKVGFRIRIGNPASQTSYGGQVLIGIDANADGKLDLFIAYDGQGSANSQGIRVYAPGSGLNNSPNTTSITTPSSGTTFYGTSSSNSGVVAVSSTSDPSGNSSSLVNAPSGATVSNLNADSKNDIFISFLIPFADLATQMSSVSSITITPDTAMSYVVLTMTQNNSINGDIGGVSGSTSSATSYTALGAISPAGDGPKWPPQVGSSLKNGAAELWRMGGGIAPNAR
jgi:hypothetical protein